MKRPPNKPPHVESESDPIVNPFDDLQVSPSPTTGIFAKNYDNGALAISERTYGLPKILAWIKVRKNHEGELFLGITGPTTKEE